MNQLQRRIAKDYADIQRRSSLMFSLYCSDMGKLIDEANKDVLGTISATISVHDEAAYKVLLANRTLDSLRYIINSRYELLVQKLEEYWTEKRSDFDILSRAAVGFIGRKSSPPWVKTKFDLKNQIATDGKFDPRKGHFNFYFISMADHIIKEIQRGALSEETMNQIMQRVRRLFNRSSKQGVRESNYPWVKSDADPESDVVENSLKGPVEVSEGFYSLEDVERFQDEQSRAMKWGSREYRPYFTDELKANNRWLRSLEQMLMSDSINLLHAGVLKIGSEEMGIEDMQWVVSRPQKECDECTIRDGLTMKEIKIKIKDEHKADVPPLHYNCRCMLVPKIKDDWADNVLKNDGVEWDPTDGKVYKADRLEKDLGMQDMTFDEYLSSVRGQ
jgi:hypothetical protein